MDKFGSGMVFWSSNVQKTLTATARQLPVSFLCRKCQCCSGFVGFIYPHITGCTGVRTRVPKPRLNFVKNTFRYVLLETGSASSFWHSFLYSSYILLIDKLDDRYIQCVFLFLEYCELSAGICSITLLSLFPHKVFGLLWCLLLLITYIRFYFHNNLDGTK